MPIVVQFESGLGNQLFQFAAGYYLSSIRNTSLDADISAYFYRKKTQGRVTYRPFTLENLSFPIRIRSHPLPILNSIRGIPRLRKMFLGIGYKKFLCSGTYNHLYENLPSNTILAGYFQDIRYFESKKSEITTIIKSKLTSCAPCNLYKIPQDYAAIHLRLGDYLDHPEFYPEWFKEYYVAAVSHLLEKNNINRVLVFSNDNKLAQSYLKSFGTRVEIAVSNPSFDGALDLLTMSTAPILSIANSSFSWWAGLLSSEQGNKVIAPSKWSSWIPNPEKSLYTGEWSILK